VGSGHTVPERSFPRAFKWGLAETSISEGPFRYVDRHKQSGEKRLVKAVALNPPAWVDRAGSAACVRHLPSAILAVSEQAIIRPPDIGLPPMPRRDIRERSLFRKKRSSGSRAGGGNPRHGQQTAGPVNGIAAPV
jgi:hypothetical protein